MKQTDVLIIGGGFAGVSTAQALEKAGIKTLLVDSKDYFEVTFATLRDIADPQYTNNSARKAYQEFLAGEFLQDAVVELAANHAVLSQGQKIHFEQAVVASGTRYPTMPVAKSHSAYHLAARNSELLEYNEQLQAAEHVLVIGGGVVGVELAGEIGFAFPSKKIVLAHNRDVLLQGFKAKAQRTAHQQLTALGVEVQFNTNYQAQQERYLDLNSGHYSEADLVFEALGTAPNSEFMQKNFSALLDRDGFVKVDQQLNIVGYTHLYALGDVAGVGEAKLGYLAQQQGDYIAKSIIAQRRNKKVKNYKRNPLMALIPTGQKTGVVQLPFAVTSFKPLVNMKQKDLFISKMYQAFER